MMAIAMTETAVHLIVICEVVINELANLGMGNIAVGAAGRC